MNTNTNTRTYFQTTFPLANVKTSRLIISLICVVFSYLFVALPQGYLLSLGIGSFELSIVQMGGFIVYAIAALMVLGGWRAFKDLAPKLPASKIPLIFFYAFVSMVFAMVSAAFVDNLQANPIINIAAISPVFTVLTGLLLIFQLFIEELLAVLSFICIYHLASKASVSSRRALVIALIISVLLAACVHIPTYNFNILQSLLVIGGARLGLGLAYAHAKNFWVAYLAHLLYDFVLITISLIAIIGFGMQV